MASRPGERIETLDGIRGIAILLVFAVHIQSMGLAPQTGTLSRWAAKAMSCGWSGVDLFFVLSGFLITGILLDTKNTGNRFRSFYSRRTLRIFPLYYLIVLSSIAVSGCSHIFFHHDLSGPGWPGWAWYLLYVQNWYLPVGQLHDMIFLGPLWSLAIEEQFYLIWPLCVWRLSTRDLVKLCIAGILLAAGFRYALTYRASTTLAYVAYMNTFARMDGLLAGALCAIVVRSRMPIAQLRFLIVGLAAPCLSGIAMLLYTGHIAWNDREVLVLGHLALSIAFGCLVLAAYIENRGGNLFDWALRARPLVVLGKYSYGIYVYQGLALAVLLHVCQHSSWWGRSSGLDLLAALCWMIATLLLAFVSFHAFEAKFMQLRESFAKTAKPSTDAAWEGASEASIAHATES